MKKIFMILSVIIMAVSYADAGCVDTYGIGSKATALGGAVAAYADDPFALYYNPAGMVLIDQKMISAGSHAISPTIDIEDYRVSETDDPEIMGPAAFSSKSNMLITPHMGYAMPVSEKLTAGVALYVPWGLEMKFDGDTAENPGAYNFFESYYRRESLTPGIAWKINDKWSAGLGVSLGASQSGADRRLYVSPDLADDPLLGGLIPDTGEKQSAKDHGAHVKVEMEDNFNYSFNVGIMYRPLESITIGLTYRSRVETDFEGDLFKNGEKVSDIEMEYDHPDQIQAGIRYVPASNRNLSFEFDLTWTNWSIADNQHEVFSSGLDIEVIDGFSATRTYATYDRDWEDTKQIRIGVEWKASDLLTWRIGYFYDPTPIPDDTLDLMWPDADKKNYTLGCGLNFGSFTVDTVLQFTDIEKSRYLGGESDNMNDSYAGTAALAGIERKVSVSADGYLWGMGITVNYKF